jgi:hypothetical protein
MHTADYLLACGLACLVVGVGLAPFVIIGLLGILLVGAGLGLLLAGGVVARSAAVPRWRAAAGMAVIVTAVVVLLWAAAEVCGLAYSDVRSKQAGLGPVPASRLAALGLVPVPGVALAAGLRLRANWPWARCAAWGAAAALAAVAAAGVFYALVDWNPLDA